MGVASLVLGIISFLVSFSFFKDFSLICGVIAIVLGIIAIAKKKRRGIAIAGVILSVLGCIILFSGSSSYNTGTITSNNSSNQENNTQPVATQTLNVQMQPNNSTYVSVDESKKIKSITVNWEKTALTNGSFNISYEQSNGFNFYGASQGVQTGYNQYSGSETIYPQANGQQVNCSKLYFSNPSWNSADVKIVSYTIEYED